MIFRVMPASPDGLDAIRDAHETLCELFDAAEEVEIDHGDGHVEVLLRLPGIVRMVDPDDLNALNGLQQWLFAHYDQREEDSPE